MMKATKTLKRLAALALALALLCGAAPAEDWVPDWDDEEELSIVELEDIPLTDEDLDAMFSSDLTDEQSEELSLLDNEIDTSINPDDLEINTRLPDNVINILLIGIDSHDKDINEEKTSHLNDVNMILSIGLDDGSIKLTSILRDTYVELPGYRNKARLNEAFYRGAGQLAMRTINHNFELNIQHYVVINFYGVASIIDRLGGIDIDMTKTEARAVNAYLRNAYKSRKFTYDTRDRSERVELEARDGVQHCDGIQALIYARLRKIDNDFARTARQRHLMELLLKQVISDIDVDRLVGLLETCLPYVGTNMTASEIASLAMLVLRSGVLARASSGESLLQQHRVPMDGMYGYLDVNGSSVINMNTRNFQMNRESIHYFIYGEYYPAN